MKIFFDHQTFSNQLYGGISKYFCELISGINVNNNNNKARLSLLWSNNVNLNEYNLQAFPYPFPARNRLLHVSNQLFNTLDCKVGHYDIYHATYFDDFLKSLIGRKPLITTFYDMTYERLSHQFAELSQDTLITQQKKKIASKASHLIAISHSTKQDMVDILGIEPERISVIYLGSSYNSNYSSTIIPHNSIKKPYLLYIGNRKGYKNFFFFLNAISQLIKKYHITLVCAGGGRFDRDEIALINSLSITESVEQIAFDNKTLPNLYREATAFIFPSLYEGFGIPILEAFSCNCPCVVSNTSSLPEVAGDAALYIDPLDRESITDALERVITDNTLRTELIRRGQQRLTLFSWKTTVEQTLNLYEKLV